MKPQVRHCQRDREILGLGVLPVLHLPNRKAKCGVRKIEVTELEKLDDFSYRYFG